MLIKQLTNANALRAYILKVCLICSLASGSIQAEEPIYVTCQCWGELGNQMFEIANAVAYALDNGYEAVFEDFKRCAGGELNYRFVFPTLKILNPDHDIVFEDCFQKGGFSFYFPFCCVPGKNTRFRGHFVNEKYFVHHRESIRQLFAPSKEILDRIHIKYNILLSTPTVAVHVRTFIRDGYHPEIYGFAGTTWDYFIKAMEHFSDDYTFLIFSDDPAWTKAYFPTHGRKVKFIEGNPHYIDLYFMSLCDHQIISPNSTFSWWAAWLNLNPDKIVIGPHIYYENTGEDALPPEWIRIQAKPFAN